MRRLIDASARTASTLTACTLAVSALALAPAEISAALSRVVPLSFDGASCDAVATASWRLPAGARLAYAARPTVGARLVATKADSYGRDDFARVTGVELRGRTLTVTVAADPVRCRSVALPGEPVDAPWNAAIDATISYVVPDHRWAQRETAKLARQQLESGFSDTLVTRCRARGQARFSCELTAYAGDSAVYGKGRLTLAQDDEWPHYDFTVKHLDDYCHAVLRRPLSRCLRTTRWRF
ncbi:MAG TPA: hypothetical protein VLK58_02890 [Conexibacter sp.]|nr:hypothetical protein [Conexibacter sp.]